MNTLIASWQPLVVNAANELFNTHWENPEFQPTRKEFEGDITLVVFPLVKAAKAAPEAIGNALGEYICKHSPYAVRYNVVKGFLNISLSDAYFIERFSDIRSVEAFGIQKPAADSKAVMVEYSSPNTNKPLHLGHIRNILLGNAVARILEAAGHKVYQTQIVNDRGIHICKSMWAWQQFGEGKNPADAGVKGDKWVGHFYVLFDKQYKSEIESLISEGMDAEEAKKKAPSLLAAQELLRLWEDGDSETIKLWKEMNTWVYDGFAETYKKLQVGFDKNYYESDTYLLGKEVVQLGLDHGVFYKKEDGSVWIDLTEDGLDEKLVLRSDGTSVYITQDIGTAIQRVKDYPDVGGMVYTVGNEQDYHFKVLFLILQKLGFDWASRLFHLSYGMVDLPSGKMKSREGTVVDADDLIDEMIQTAKETTETLGKLDGYSEEEKNELYQMIGLGALKYFILKVDPKKRILFDPNESVDFNGNTGPFLQYTHARIQSVKRKATFDWTQEPTAVLLNEKEKSLIKMVDLFPSVIQQAAANYSPALIANYSYDLGKEFNSFYQSTPILPESDEKLRMFRVQLADATGRVLKTAFELLGIQVPDRM